MSDNPTIGKTILQAFQFMKMVQKDTLAVVTSLEMLLSEEKWRCNETSVGSGVGSSLNADRWMVSSIYRIYVRNADLQASSSLGAIHITFKPPEGYDEPICLCIAGAFPTPVSSKNLFNHWRFADSMKLLRGLFAAGSLESDDAKLIKFVFPDADRGAVFVVKLCDLTDEAKVKSLVAEPLLQAIEGLK